uniref:Large ribosomal subunit protein uL22c n=1 Tax=Lepocinclis playfairiana TaxID=1403386 RepID=A0A3G3LLI1_9EUGL|nr:ribosomal protein L22 [Lepocinclis playfairiana]AYQ93572.1 ribosomal protein L22 [Lepocinclis playfairiana]
METYNIHEAVCKVRYVKISPIKARRIINQIRNRTFKDAVTILSLLPHRSCPIILKALKSAASNFRQVFGVDNIDLLVTEVKVDNAPFLKRICPHAQGRAFPIKKHFSHITIAV